MFMEKRPQRFCICGPLMNRTLRATEIYCTALLRNCLGFCKTHLGLTGCDHDRFSIGRNFLQPLHEGANFRPTKFRPKASRPPRQGQRDMQAF